MKNIIFPSLFNTYFKELTKNILTEVLKIF